MFSSNRLSLSPWQERIPPTLMRTHAIVELNESVKIRLNTFTAL